MLTLDRNALTHDEARELRHLRQLVHHDLRTPLTSIMGFAELLLERELPPEKRRQLTGFIASEAARLQEQLDQLV